MKLEDLTKAELIDFIRNYTWYDDTRVIHYILHKRMDAEFNEWNKLNKEALILAEQAVAVDDFEQKVKIYLKSESMQAQAEKHWKKYEYYYNMANINGGYSNAGEKTDKSAAKVY